MTIPTTEDRTVAVVAEGEALGHEVGAAPSLIEEELLVEDVSIDGMCGVY